MIYRLALSFCFSLLFLCQTQAQLSRIFYPNVTLRAEYLPDASMGTNQKYGLNRASFFAMMPIQSEVGVNYSLRKKFDLRARHTFAVGNYAQINPTVNGKETPANGYKSISVGVVMLQASWKDKLWVYGGGLGMTETNETFFTPQPFLWGGAARMRIFGAQSQLIYGTAFIYNQKFRVIPIIGFNKKLSPNWRTSALLPFMLNFNYHPTGWYNFDFKATVNGYSGGFLQQAANEKLLRRSNYQDIRLSAIANVHLFTVLNISLEGGVSAFRQLKDFNGVRENISANSPALVPFVGVSVRYITSNAKISSTFMRKLGFGGDGGVNW